MKRVVLLLALICLSMSIAAEEPPKPFELLDLHIGQPIVDAVKKYPAMECENSCALEEQKAFGKPGKLWVGIESNKISQLAFRFRPALTSSEAKEIRTKYIRKYGQASDHLGGGCDEWKASGGYLAICLSPELSHIWWSTQSRVDINIQNQRKQK